MAETLIPLAKPDPDNSASEEEDRNEPVKDGADGSDMNAANPESTGEIENRKAPRTITDLKAIIQFQIAPEKTWKEVTRVVTVSKSGASFLLAHHCDVGRLVTLVMPLPKEFRAYDFSEKLYPVIGLVQYCYEATVDEKPSYSVGVAFVGKNFPDGYSENPLQNYHISGTTESGMWQIKPSAASFTVRSATRHRIPLDVTISLIRKDRSSGYKEQTITMNISTSGASVICSLDAEIGERVKFASKEHDFYSIAIVRNRKVRDGKPPLLHLEFVDNRFPLEKITFPGVTPTAP